VVPRQESMAAFDALVRSGKVRYLGSSNDTAYGVTKSNMICEHQGLSRFESIQNNFSLLKRRFLDEMVEMCREEKISLLPYSPIGGGVLSGKYNAADPPVGRFSDYISSNDQRVKAMASRFVNDKTLASTRQYMEIAREAGLSPVTMAVAWSKQFDFVASTIIGARHPDQLDESLAAMDIELSAEVLAACDTVHDEIPYPMGW
ncbi:MAG: aldo/keto reductase, partial [Thermodesulfobacteriota bacterium]